jgi:PKD repeat protein
MINQKKNIFLLMCLFIMASTPVALCNTPHIIYVAGDGTGNYNCDGKNDQVQINQALEYAAKNTGTTVYLKGPFVYDIEGSCLVGSNTDLTGDSSAKLRLANNVGWTTAGTGTPIIGQIGGIGTAVHDIKIHGFEIDGNEGAQSGLDGGRDLNRVISFQGSSSAPVSNISVYNMNLHDSKGDGFRCTNGKNIYYYNNVGNNLEHTCVIYSRVKFGEIHNNEAHQCCCAANRLDNCQDITIANETISPYRGATTYVKDSKGYALSDAGVQICDSVSSPATSNIIIRDCSIMSGVNGVWLADLKDASNVNIYNNVVHDSGYENEGVSRNGGIGISGCGNGITIQNNNITSSYVAGININSAVPGTHTVTVANNNIMNGQTGYAIKSSVASNVDLILTHNYLYKNPANFYPASLVDTNPATSPNSKLETQSLLPTANFSCNVTNGYAPLTVQFTDLSTKVARWNWSFGDGTNSTDQNPTHTYSAAGKYTVNLKVSNSNGTNSKLATITVLEIPAPVLPVANFSSYNSLSVQFTDLSENATRWDWDFGDRATSTEQDPTHTYSAAGKYTVNLTVSNENGTNSKLDIIMV